MHNIPFDGLSTYIVFLIGVPAFVIESMPGELRRVLTSSYERMGWMIVTTGSWVVGALAVTAFGILTLTQCPFADGTTQIKCVVPVFAIEIPEDFVLITMLGLLTLTAAGCSFFVIHRYSRRTSIVAALRHEVERDLPRTGMLNVKALNDLAELGQDSQGGQDKEYVLKAMSQLVAKATKYGYHGDNLESVAQGLVKVIATDPHVGSSENYAMATEILLDIVKANPPFNSNGNSPDVLHCAEVLGVLGKSALRELEKHLSGEKVASGFVQALGRTAKQQPVYLNLVSESLRDIGIEAIGKDKMFVAMKVLNELTVLLERPAPIHPEVMYDTISLLAHFWERGAATQRFAQTRLAKIEPVFQMPLAQILHTAQDHAAHTGHFISADCIQEMAEQVVQSADVD